VESEFFQCSFVKDRERRGDGEGESVFPEFPLGPVK
jgi:hypothetical protein